MSDASAVCGYTVHDLPRMFAPKARIMSGKIPEFSSKRNLMMIPPTIIGMTIPRKMIDLSAAPPLTPFRSTASTRPRITVMGRCMMIQMPLWISEPQGGPFRGKRDKSIVSVLESSVLKFASPTQ